MVSKNTICLWFNGTAAEAAQFYAETFPDSAVGTIHRAPGDYPSRKQGDILPVEFTVIGIPCIGLNGGPEFEHNEAFSFQVATDDQAETDRLWNAIVRNGGQESACGWCKDRWGLSWQITPKDRKFNGTFGSISEPGRRSQSGILYRELQGIGRNRGPITAWGHQTGQGWPVWWPQARVRSMTSEIGWSCFRAYQALIEFVVRRRLCLRVPAQVRENVAHRYRLGDEGDDPHLAAAQRQ